MKRASITRILLLTGFLAGCSTTHWEYPYPPVTSGKSPSEKQWYSKGGRVRHDAVEKNPDYEVVFARIDSEVDEAVKDHPENGDFGFSHTWSATKRRILYWKYGVDWHDIQAMTPGLVID